MDKKPILPVVNILLIFYSTAAFLYILFIVQPELYLHHAQPSFLISYGYVSGYAQYPGGLAEVAGNLIMQAFAWRFPGAIVLFIVSALVWFLMRELLNRISQKKLNDVLALVPFTLVIVLVNNYKLPFSVVVSVIVLLLLLQLITWKARFTLGMLFWYLAGAVSVYWFSGSGYFLIYSVTALFMFIKNNEKSRYFMLVFIPVFSLVFPFVVSQFIYPLTFENRYFYFFAPEFYFMAYQPGVLFSGLLLATPVLVLLAGVYKVSGLSEKGRGRYFKEKHAVAIGFSVVFLLACIGHRLLYQPDVKKIVATDFYCYHNNPAEVAKAAKGLQNYNFAANVNYNLSMSKAGKLTDSFFDFFQISGTLSIFPDYKFSPDVSFIATDFYYHLGYISEARHWAYESLVFYPHSQRAMKSLVKIHLVVGQYKAAERYLKLLEKSFNAGSFVRKYKPYFADTSLISKDEEIMYKKSCIPAGRELTPFIQQRFVELVETNRNNQEAYEWLMLYHLLEGELEQFMDLYNGNELSESSAVYEEAILLYGEKKGIPVVEIYKVSNASVEKFMKFKRELHQYNGKQRTAMNEMYREYGNSYLFFLQFIYPRIIKPDYIIEYDENQVL